MASATQHGYLLPKAIASIAYLVKQTQESLYPLMKMIYLAEKCHLERYGRMITGDTYVAMAKGPVPSVTYDLMKFVRGDRTYFEGGEPARALFAYDKASHLITLRETPDFSALSESEIECLDCIVAELKAKGPGVIRELSHDDAWRATSRNADMALDTIAAQFEDGAALVQHLSDRFPGSAH